MLLENNMNDEQKNEFNLQIRKILKQFGVKAHHLVENRFNKNLSNCEVSLKLEIDSESVEEVTTEDSESQEEPSEDDSWFE